MLSSFSRTSALRSTSSSLCRFNPITSLASASIRTSSSVTIAAIRRPTSATAASSSIFTSFRSHPSSLSSSSTTAAAPSSTPLAPRLTRSFGSDGRYHSSSSSSSSSSFASFGLRLLAATGVGIACYYAVTGDHQREVLNSLFPESEQMRLEQYRQRVQRGGGAAGGALSGQLVSHNMFEDVAATFSNVPPVLQVIIGINLFVFALHQLPRAINNPRLENLLWRHLSVSYDGLVNQKLFHTTLTSVFSHHGFLHLLVNMYTLASIAPAVIHLIGETEFLGFYLGCGIFSSLFGVGWTALFRNPTWRYQARTVPSLGASGSLLGVLGLIAVFFPANEYAIMLLPKSFRADDLTPCIAVFDTIGLGYKLALGPSAGLPLGHAAHLSGLVFGYTYANTLAMRLPQVKARVEYNKRMKQLGF